MLKLGIECENLEDPKSRWGVGHLVLNLLEEYVKNPELQEKFKLYLYFKNSIPEDKVFQNPIFVKRVSGTRSFNIFYHILMPVRAMFDRLDMMFFPAYMLPPLYLGKAVVMLTEDVFYEYKKGALPFRYKLAYRLFTNWSAIKATKILAISETSKKQVSKLYGIKPERIFVAHLGVKKPSTTEKDPRSDNYILYVGQMFPRRRATELAKAFGEIASDFPDLNLVMVGRDKYNPPCVTKLIEEMNNNFEKERIFHFEYIDDDKDLEKLYNGARLFAYISSSEAFGLPPVEAAAHGVPVVVKDSDLNHELFDDVAFFVKDETSIESIATTLREAMNNEQRRILCIEKNKNIADRLSWSNFAKNFLKNVH